MRRQSKYLRPARGGGALLFFGAVIAALALWSFISKNKPASVGEAIAQAQYGEYQLTFEKIEELDCAKVLSEGSANLLGVRVPAQIIRNALPSAQHKVVFATLVQHGGVKGTYFYRHYLLLTTANVPDTPRFVIRQGKYHGYIVGHNGRVEYLEDRAGASGWLQPDPRDYDIAIAIMQWDGEWKAGASKSAGVGAEITAWKEKLTAQANWKRSSYPINGNVYAWVSVDVQNGSERRASFKCKYYLVRQADPKSAAHIGELTGIVERGRTTSLSTDAIVLADEPLTLLYDVTYEPAD